ncbi:EAL domain-containing protein [Marinomonas sp. 2405UD68-3]|uniref:EAL domain-containing protein n=1 Tax=Marinomonas sp. 2405UD68-3 TaxID=3391835 RepID=UPI0039C9899A
MLVSFRSKLIALFIGLLTLVQLGSAIAVLDSMKRGNLEQGIQTLQVASNVFELTLDERASQLITSVRILASDFGFKQAVATRENDTIQSVLNNHGGRINADVSLLLSPRGELLTSTRDVIEEKQFQSIILLARRSGRRSIVNIVEIESRTYQMVFVPVRAPNVIAWVGMGFLLNEALANKVKNVTNLDISFLNKNRSDMAQVVSTLPEADRVPLFSALTDLDSLIKTPLFTNDEAYLSNSVKLNMDSQWAVLHLPFHPWLENYQSARNQLITIFAITLSLAILSAWFAAKSMVRPIQSLVEFAKQIGRGEKNKAPNVNGEFGVLSGTMIAMQNDIVKREEELTYRASHDLLTGLYNRSAVEKYLSEYLPRDTGSLILINIRHFKDINNMMGFENGDLLLKLFAQRLSEVSGECDQLARLGGDEFLIIHPECFSEDEIKSLVDSCSGQFHLSGSSINLQLSIGVLPFAYTSNDVNKVMRRIDIATNLAKETSNGVAIYEMGQDESHQRELTIIRDLPEALETGQLFMVYQPKVNLSKRQCIASEALIRWVHPALGFIPPDEFIRLVEQSGNIKVLTQWVIQKVLEQQVIWRENGIRMQVAINLSAHDLQEKSLPSQIQALLDKFELDASVLALEVTESAVMADTDTVICVLGELKKLGCKLSIDDFGTGQSSLAYLRDLPVDEVKIDRTFVKDIDTNKNDALIVSATVQLSHGFGFTVTAEGMENQVGLGILESYECDTIQGYYFSKPLPALDFGKWVAEFNTDSSKWWGK